MSDLVDLYEDSERNDPEILNLGLVAKHKQPCAVFHDKEHAVYNINEDVFAPSWRAQEEGWWLVEVAPGWRRWLVRRLCNVY